MRIMMCKRTIYCTKYLIGVLLFSILVGLYISALRHNIQITNKFHLKALKAQMDMHSNLHRTIGLHVQGGIGLHSGVKQGIHSNMQQDSMIRGNADEYLNVQQSDTQRGAVKMMQMSSVSGSQSSEVDTGKRKSLDVYIVDEHHEGKI